MIDLSNLRFVAVGEAYAGDDGIDDGDEDDEDDIVNQENEDENGGNRRRLDNETDNASEDGSDPLLIGTALDIAVFHLVSRLLCCRSADVMTETTRRKKPVLTIKTVLS